MHVKPLSPILKWAGGKTWLAPIINQVLKNNPPNSRIVELFCGGAGMSFGLNRPFTHLNDSNSHLINFYRQVKDGLSVSIFMENSVDAYGYYKRQFNRHDSGEKIDAQLFYYLNKTCFNGLMRYNESGAFNVSFGKYKSVKYAKNFDAYTELFRNWTFSNLDFAEVETTEDDIIFADPPYDDSFVGYTKNGFNFDDQIRLSYLLKNHPGTVIACNKATPRILELYRDNGFSVNLIDAPRSISCDGDRSPVQEMVATLNLKF